MMHKSNQNNALRERNGLRILVAISLTIFLAGVGACTTNYTPGNGQPTGSTAYGAGTHAATYGSSSGTEGVKPQSRMIVAPEVITPMFSSSSEAIAVLAGHEGRFLGYANPGPGSANYSADIVTGQVIPPALTANPQQTVNSSISSAPTPVITAGDGGGGAAIFGGVSTGAVTSGVTAGVTNGTTSAVTAPITAGAPLFGTSTTAATPTNAATAATVTQNTGFLTPTVTSGATPTPTTAANPPVGNVGTASNATTSAVTTTPAVGTTTTRTGSGTLSVGRQVNFPATVSPSAVSNTGTAVTSPIAVSPTVTTVRSRAVSQPVAITAPVTIPGRVARPVRMTTSGGSVVITNQ
jgi:hypothetical protein